MTSQENEAGQECIRDDNLSNRQHRSVYLITYSQADEQSHKNGGIHYHMAVKLDRYQRWLKVRNYVDTKHGIKLHFSSVHAIVKEIW